MNNCKPCPEWAEKLAARHPKDLSLLDRRELSKHLQSCDACARVREDYNAIVARARATIASEESQSEILSKSVVPLKDIVYRNEPYESVPPYIRSNRAFPTRPVNTVIRAINLFAACAVVVMLILAFSLLLHTSMTLGGERTSLPSVHSSAIPQVNNSFPSYIPGHGRLIMYDPLTGNSRGYKWEGLNTQAGSCQFTKNGYDIKASDFYFGCLEYGRGNITNFVLEAQIVPHSGSAGGLSFRDASNEAGYYVDVSPSGYYSIAGPRSGNSPDLRGPTLSPLIPKNQRTYLIDILAVGNRITLYVNGKKIDSVTDSTSKEGYIGLYVTGDAGHNNTQRTEASFKEVRVWSLT